MDNGTIAMRLLKFMDEKYPICSMKRQDFRIQSSCRWAIIELVNRLLNNPFDQPINVAEELVGQVVSMMYKKYYKLDVSLLNWDSIHMKINMLDESLKTLLNAENYINEVCK